MLTAPRLTSTRLPANYLYGEYSNRIYRVPYFTRGSLARICHRELAVRRRGREIQLLHSRVQRVHHGVRRHNAVAGVRQNRHHSARTVLRQQEIRRRGEGRSPLRSRCRIRGGPLRTAPSQ